VPTYFPAGEKRNVGVLDGAPSGGLVDCDLDDPVALQIADEFMPPTHSEFGRKSKLRSHRLYTCDPPPERTVRFEEQAEGKKKRTYVEVRSSGAQTVFPGSVHKETGEAIEWHRDGQPAKVDAQVLIRAAARTAVVALIVRYMPEPNAGKRHNLFLSLAGWLLRAGWTLAETSKFIQIISKAVGEDAATRRDRIHDVETTGARLQKGQAATGLPTVAQILGERVTQYLSQWLRLEPECGVPGTTVAAEEPPEMAVPPFPVEVLPEPARELVRAGAAALACPEDLIGLPVLAALGVAIGTRRRIEVKEGWEEFPVIYGAPVAEPGGAKSPAQRFATAPLHDAHRRFHEDFTAAMRQWEAQRKQAEKGASPNPAPETPLPPRRRQIISTDATVEALGLLLRENSGILYEQDELSALPAGFNRYRKGIGNDRQFFQSAWNCQPIVIHRVKNAGGQRLLDTLEVPLPFVAVLGGIPPDSLGELSDERNRQDGFVHRWLFSWPESVPPACTDVGLPEEIRKAYEELVGKLLHLPAQLVDAPLHFTPFGQTLWFCHADSHTLEMNELAFPDNLRGPWRKLLSYAARFCIILQLSRYVCGEADSELVDETSVEGAWTLVRYFKEHLGKVYRRLKKEPPNEKTIGLLEWITAQGGQASIRQVLSAKVAGCRTKGDVLAIFERLQRGRVGFISSECGHGPASVIFRLGRAE
jgi:hypothetical protein